MFGIKWEKRDLKRAVVVAIASVLMALNIKTFVRTGGLYPGGATGLTILIQRIAQQYFGLELPFSIINILLNAFPVYIGFRYIGKKFTLFSCEMILLTSVMTDLIPGRPITYDTLLISIFGGLINGAVMTMCLRVNATTGGTDFISIYMSQKTGQTALTRSLVSMRSSCWRRAISSAGTRHCTPSFSSILPPRRSICSTATTNRRRCSSSQTSGTMSKT